MTHHSRIAGALLYAAALAPAVCAGAAQANDISFISTAGHNANACTSAAPCRTLQRAIAVTANGGEIRVLDSGFFGNNATTRKPLTITGNGHTVLLGSPITIDAGGATVALRGLTLNGRGTIPTGINITAAAAVYIEHCVIHDFASTGIEVTADGVKVFISDSTSRHNGSRGVTTAGGSSRMTIDNSRFENNRGVGVIVLSGRATISRSTVSGNGTGVAVLAASVGVMLTMVTQNGGVGLFAGSGGALTVESSVAGGNSIGLFVENGGVVGMSNSTFADNTTGISNGGTVKTRKNNTVRGNGTNLSGGALTPIGGL